MFKKIRTIGWFFLLITTLVNASPEPIKKIVELKGGVNLSKWKDCLQQTNHQCAQNNKPLPSIPKFLNCYLPFMEKYKICTQNKVLFNLANVYDIEAMRTYHQIQVIKTSVLMADLSMRFIIISPQGEVIQLAAIIDFPDEAKTSNGNTRLIFRQILKNGCMACASLGFVRVAYDFDKSGHFLQFAIL